MFVITNSAQVSHSNWPPEPLRGSLCFHYVVFQKTLRVQTYRSSRPWWMMPYYRNRLKNSCQDPSSNIMQSGGFLPSSSSLWQARATHSLNTVVSAMQHCNWHLSTTGRRHPLPRALPGRDTTQHAKQMAPGRQSPAVGFSQTQISAPPSAPAPKLSCRRDRSRSCRRDEEAVRLPALTHTQAVVRPGT